MNLRCLLFDVLGTIVDLKGSLIRGLQENFIGDQVSPVDLADEWIAQYPDYVEQINNGDMAFLTVDQINAKSLEDLLTKYGLGESVTANQRQELCSLWHRLDPWPDAVAGIDELRKNYFVGTLSNANVELLGDLSTHGQLRWDRILSGEHFRRYKPDPAVYLQAAECLGLPTHEIMLVASHEYDLKAAKECGYKTALVSRDQLPTKIEATVTVTGIDQLSERLQSLKTSDFIT